MGCCNLSMFCWELLCVHSGFVVVLVGRSVVAAMHCMASWCLVVVMWLFFTVLPVCLQFMIVVFLDNTHLLFLLKECICFQKEANSFLYD